VVEQSFGIGCFHFGLRQTPPPGFTIRDFMAEVEKAIGSVPNVDRVEVSSDSEVYDETMPPSDNPPELSAGGPYPYLLQGHISFDLLIPARMQKQLSVDPVFSTETERFKLDIYYRYHLPVAVIQPVNPSSESDPSNAVIIVRELLEREVGQQQQSLVDFQVMGPSPLHANFYLTAVPADRLPIEWDFDLEVESKRGYDRYDFFFNESHFSDAEEALDVLQLHLLDELDLYYLITQREAQKLHAWEGIGALTDELIDLHRKRGFRAFLKRTFKSSRLVNETFVSLAEFEGDQILGANYIREAYRHTYKADTVPYLREMVDRNMAERAAYPTEQVRSLLQLFETRRLSATELRVVLISAISGGAVGAVVTVLVGGP
jgi:hypothetical protein